MEIKACTIMGFGKFHRRSFSFSDGIHVIYGENEAGKTTLRTFLVSMLFGIDRKRGAASKKDEFHKYQPYMGGIYGGSLDFSFQGEDYQIQRDFSNGKDIVIYETAMGKKVLEGQEPSGHLFSMTKEGFLQTLCISQGAMKTDKSLSQMIKNYMANMSQSKTTDVNVEKAISYLRREIRRSQKAPVYDELNQIRAQIRDLEDQEEEFQAILREEREIEGRLHQKAKPQTLLERIVEWIRRIFGFPDKRALERQKWEYQLEILKIKKEQIQKKQEFNEDLRIRFENLKKEVEETEYNRKAMEAAMRAIMEASEEIHKEFGSSFHEKVSSIIAEITNGAYEKVKIDDSMGIVVEKDGSFLDIDYLSTGTVEQIYFAVRLAAADLLFPEEEFPMILDDVFGNFDDVRLRKTLSYLSKSHGQIVIFTCRKEVLAMLEQLGCDYQKTVL